MCSSLLKKDKDIEVLTSYNNKSIYIIIIIIIFIRRIFDCFLFYYIGMLDPSKWLQIILHIFYCCLP